NDRNPDRKLRIGYVSPNFFKQAEAHFVLPLLRAHDRERAVEVHCYAITRQPDAFTDLHRASVDAWHDVTDLDDEALARQIEADGIDIAVDLSMHMNEFRLAAFARKPAPVQVTWLAYPGTTGIAAIDYRLTDAHMDPPDSDQSWSAERAVRLPDSWCCYD